MLVWGCGSFVDGSPGSSASYKAMPQSNPMEIGTIEGDSPVDEEVIASLAKVPEYHGPRVIPWESGRTIFQG